MSVLIVCLLEDQAHGGRSRGHEHKSRARDIFPLLAIGDDELRAVARDTEVTSFSSFAQWCKLTVIGLNSLAGFASQSESVKANVAQVAVQTRVAHKVARLCRRFAKCTVPDGRTCLAELIADHEHLGRTANPPLVAEDCDLLDRSGLVDPLPDLDEGARSVSEDPDKLFVHVSKTLKAIPRIRRSDLSEYCKLVVRQLRSHKVELSAVAHSGAGVSL